MAHYHLEVQAISRGKGRSFTRLASYITGRRLIDSYLPDKIYYHNRDDVAYWSVLLPRDAPVSYTELDVLCRNLEKAERRYDARTGRCFIGSLPNELTLEENILIVKEFVSQNFLLHNLCAIAAIHTGISHLHPNKNNPHMHLLVPTRGIDQYGFHPRKDRRHDNRNYIEIWRRAWADVQNQAYRRADHPARVSHESLEVQGLNREPMIHLSVMDWQREKRGVHTRAGDINRDIAGRNQKREMVLEHDLAPSPALKR